MKTCEELRQDRAKVIHDMRELSKTANEAGRDLNAEEQEKYDRMAADCVSIKKRYERMEAEEALQGELDANRGGGVDPLKQRGGNRGDPADPDATVEPIEKIAERVLAGCDDHRVRAKVQEGIRARFRAENHVLSTPGYARAWEHYIRGRGSELIRALETGDNGEGGYLVPTDTSAQLIRTLNDFSVMRPICTVRQLSRDTDIPVVPLVTAGWADEEADLFGSLNEPTFTVFNARARKIKCASKVSQELLDDGAVDVGQVLAEEFGKAIAKATDDDYLTGPGTTRPTGAFSGFTDKAVTSATTFTATELRNHYFALPQKYRNGSVWVMNDLTLAFIAAMSADSNNEFLLNPSLREGQFDRILGKPVYTNDSIDKTGAANAELALFFNPDYYMIVDRIGSMRFYRLNEVFRGNDQVGFLQTFRTDGGATLADAGRVLKLAAS